MVSEIPLRTMDASQLHSRDITSRAFSGWDFALENESVKSFLARSPPSKVFPNPCLNLIANCDPFQSTAAWVSARHQGRNELIKAYYDSGGPSDEVLDPMVMIESDWDAVSSKSTEALMRLLKTHAYGSGKWMLFVSPDKIDSVWTTVLMALWAGRLGLSAKVSGKQQDKTKGHVICIYADPFWEQSEVERVLHGLRESGIKNKTFFKADGVTLLGIYRDNPYGIPPTFYEAAYDSCDVNSVSQTIKDNLTNKQKMGKDTTPALPSASNKTSKAKQSHVLLSASAISDMKCRFKHRWTAEVTERHSIIMRVSLLRVILA